MLRQLLVVALIGVSLPGMLAAEEMRLGETTTVAFASVDEGKRVLTNRDDFVQSMSPFDRAARLKTDKDVSEAQYLEFVGRSVLAWNEAEKRKAVSAMSDIQSRVGAWPLPWPEKMLLIKTTGDEEGDAPYTRANAVVFPGADLSLPVAKLRKTLCHELFHVLSRANPELRERLYATIGFVKCGEVEFPPELKPRKITNPDAPKNDHGIRVRVDGDECWAVPILFSRTERYDIGQGGRFFDYMVFRFLLLERRGESFQPILRDAQPRLVDARQLSGFMEQVGENTGYIIHPEEILADSFALLVLGEKRVPSPEIIERLEKELRGKPKREPNKARDTAGPGT
jgi:hypothetical protein